MKNFRWTIKRKLLALGGATLLPLLLFLALWASWQIRLHTEDFQAEAALASLQAASHLDGLLEFVSEHLKALADDPGVRRLRRDRMEEFFRKTKEEHPDFENVFAAAADGRTLGAAVPEPAGVPATAADLPWFRRVMATGEPAVGGFQIGHIVSKPVVVVAVPIREGTNHPAAVLAISLSLHKLEARFRSLPVTRGMTVTVLDGEGQVLSRVPQGEGVLGRRLPSPAPHPGGFSIGEVLTGSGGPPEIVGTAPVGGTGWRVLVGIPRAKVQARIRKEIWAIALPFFAIVGLSSLLGLLIARRVWRPLQDLTGAARRLPSAMEPIAVSADSTDEVGELARAFNLMAERLERSFSALAERTRQIETLHEAARVLATEVDRARLLQGIVETACELIEARYGALSLFGADGRITHFFTVGLTPEERERIGPLPEGRSILGHVFKNEQTLRLEDLATHPAAVGFPPGHPPMRSLLAAPIRFRGGILGALYLTEKPGGFTADDERVLTTLCVDAGATIANARLFEQSEQRRLSAEALAAVGRELAQSLDVATVAQQISDNICRLLGVFHSAFYRLEPESGDLVVVAVSGDLGPSFVPNLTFPRGMGAVGLAVRDRVPVSSENVLVDPRISFPPELRRAVEYGEFRSILAVPLIAKGQVVGVIGVRDKAGRVFTEDEIRVAQAFADQAAVALENARLYEASEARRRSAEALAAVGRDLTQSLEPAEVAQRITDIIRELLRVGYSRIYRLEPESGDLVAVAVSGGTGAGLDDKLIIPRGIGVVGVAVRERRPVVSADFFADPRITFTPEVRARMEQRFRAVIAVPLVVKERMIGALVAGDHPGRVFDPEQIQLAQAFADQAAVALENARLFGETQRALDELQKAQEELIRGATMRALGELASGAAHHLNNLLAIMLGRVRLLMSGPHAAPVRRPLEVIERAATDASEVVRRVSRFARMQPIEEWQPVDLKELAAEALEMTRARWQDAAQAQGIRIEATLEGQDVPAVTGNAAALREVLINLLLNAADALPNGGRITLRVFSEDGWVGLAVTDTGTGMSPQVSERAREPFFTTKGPKSVGLGLSLAYGILERHGGKLTIESAEGRGTTVTMRLPLGSPSEARRPRPREEAARPGAPALRVLVIDDDDEVREMLVEMLGALGYKVFEATDGRQGLALLEAGETVDLVLTDLGMPGMTGWEVARAVKARWPRVPVGMLTGWGDQIDEATADREAVAGILSKPVTPESLQEFIATCRGAPRRA